MSRREFRVEVADARPPSAWAMVAIASATLWITQQLQPWALVVQVLAILASLALRTRPLRWQSSAWALNAGMFGITAATIAVALEGEPSTIALAHFAALTQGLQLLDARPRRTEFLLVALALFQVVLAANLTDSVFFTPLLCVFIFATVWTLVVHTLRSEAIEAGLSHELGRAFTPALVRTTLVASGVAVLLALVLFVTLPRLRTQVLRAPGVGAAMATAGFSDRVEFGELGRIRGDPRVVMRVETLDGEAPPRDEAYWRGLAFDHFDGRAWSITPPSRRPVPGSAEGGVELGRDPENFDLVQRIVREPVAAGVLFRIGSPRGLQGTVRRLERDVSGGLYAASQVDERVRYTVRTLRAQPGAAALRGDRARAPRGRTDALAMRPPLSPEVTRLAGSIVADAESDAERARAIERYLLRSGRYTDVPPAPGEDGLVPIERFLLGELAGHCEYFASAMVVLAREVGLPARLVNGFAGGRTNRIGGFVELTHSDAHAWVEIHYERAGWVRYDPTPADLRTRAEVAGSWLERARDLGSALELWWFQRVVGFDRSDQIGALKSAWLAWHGRSAASSRRAARPQVSIWRRTLSRPEAGVLLVCTLGIGGSLFWLWRHRTRRAGPHPPYSRALRLLERHGLARPEGATARAFANEVSDALSPPVGRAFEELTECYLLERFGERRADSERALHSLRQALRA